MTIIEQKKVLRKQMLSQRSKLLKPGKEKYDQWICKALWAKIEQQQYETIHCYIPIGTEINITPLIELLLKKGRQVIAPKTLPKRRLKNLILKSLDELEKGVFGTVHPAGGEEFLGVYDLIITPGLSFDSNNYRLGYGGAYYDTFLTKNPTVKNIGIFYPFQEVENIPLEPHDVRLDEILVDRLFMGV